MKLLVFALLPAAALCQMMLAGGISETTVSNTDEPVAFAISETNSFLTAHSLLGAPVDSADVTVVSARTQVVAGQNLFLTLRMGDTGYTCDVTVWYRAWLHNEERLQMTNGPTCTKATAARRQLGAPSDPHPYSSANAEVTNAMEFAVCALNDASNSMNYGIVDDTSGVTYTQQTTAGMTYTFYNVVVKESDCQKSGDCDFNNLQSCSPKAHGGMVMSCTLVIQWQAWMDPAYTMTSNDCTVMH